MENEYKASGILIMTLKQNQAMVLLFKEQRSNGIFWIDIGGRREHYDDSSWDTATRELNEESNGLLSVHKDEIVESIWVPSAKYIIYLVYKENLQITKNLRWFPLDVILRAPRRLYGTPVHARLSKITQCL